MQIDSIYFQSFSFRIMEDEDDVEDEEGSVSLFFCIIYKIIGRL